MKVLCPKCGETLHLGSTPSHVTKEPSMTYVDYRKRGGNPFVTLEYIKPKQYARCPSCGFYEQWIDS